MENEKKEAKVKEQQKEGEEEVLHELYVLPAVRLTTQHFELAVSGYSEDRAFELFQKVHKELQAE